MGIVRVVGREILDSRDNPTVKVDVHLASDAFGRAAVPSNASAGGSEAIELRDGDKNRYGDKDILRAVDNVNRVITPAILRMSALNQREIGHKLLDLDGAKTKSDLGVNTMLGVSLAVAKTAASYLDLPLCRYIGGTNIYVLPVPMMNIINEGPHSDTPIAFQEFMIRLVGAKGFREGLHMGAKIFHALKKVLHGRGLSAAVGDEGGFAPALDGTEDALNSIMAAIKAVGYKPGKDMTIAMDCVASEFYHDDVYDYTKFEGRKGAKRNAQQQVVYLSGSMNKYPIDSTEDGMDENDWASWQMLTPTLDGKCQLVGDDLSVTNVRFSKKDIEKGYANSTLIRISQIGTLSETLDAIEMAHRDGHISVTSHRSGETEDATVADIAVATNSGQIRTGSLSRSNRMAKYDQLFRIEEELGFLAIYGYKTYKK